MKIGHFLYGREDNSGFRSKCSRDFEGLDTTLVITREDASRPGFNVIEVRSEPNNGRTVLSNASRVETAIVETEQGLVETAVRPFAYTQSVTLDWQNEGGAHPEREALKHALELVCCSAAQEQDEARFLLDNRSYSQVMNNEENWLEGDRFPEHLEPEALRAGYEAWKQQRLQAGKELTAADEADENNAAQYGLPDLGTDDLAAFLSALWEACWQKGLRSDAQPAILLCTSPRYFAEDIDPQLSARLPAADAATFFHDYVIDHLPDAVARMTSIALSTHYDNAGNTPAAVMNCLPEGDFSDGIFFVPFASAVGGNGSFDRTSLLLGHAMLGGMPESYLRLEKRCAGKRATAGSFITAWRMVRMIDLCSGGLNPENAQICKAEYENIRATLLGDGFTEAEITWILAPLLMQFAQAAKLMTDSSFDADLYLFWVSENERVSVGGSLFDPSEHRELVAICSDLLTQNQGTINNGALFHMAQAGKSATEEQEAALLRNAYQHENGIDREALSVFIQRIRSLDERGSVQLADAYASFIADHLRDERMQDPQAIVITRKRRESLRTVTDYADRLPDMLLADVAAEHAVKEYLSDDSEITGQNITDLLAWYNKARGDAELEPLATQSVLPAVHQYLTQLSRPNLAVGELASSLNLFIRAMNENGWNNAETDAYILKLLLLPGYAALVENEELLAAADAFFGDGKKKVLQQEFAQQLQTLQAEAGDKLSLSQTESICRLPIGEDDRARLLACLLKAPATQEDVLGDDYGLRQLSALGKHASAHRILIDAMADRYKVQLNNDRRTAVAHYTNLLQMVEASALTEAEAEKRIRELYPVFMQNQIPDDGFCQALESLMKRYNIRKNISPVVREWASEQVQESLDGTQDRQAVISGFTKVLGILSIPVDEVFRSTVSDKCKKILSETESAESFPSNGKREEARRLLKSASIPVGQMESFVKKQCKDIINLRAKGTAFPTGEFLNTLKDYAASFGVNMSEFNGELQAWCKERLRSQESELSESVPGALQSICAALDGVEIAAFRSESLDWLRRIVENKKDQGSRMTPSFVRELSRAADDLQVDKTELSGRMTAWCEKCLESTNIFNTDLDEAITELSAQGFKPDGTAIADKRMSIADKRVAEICRKNEGALPSPEDLREVKDFCDTHGLKWREANRHAVDACEKLLGKQPESGDGFVISEELLVRLANCDDVLEVPHKSRTATINDWLKLAIDKSDRTALPTGEFIRMLSCAVQTFDAGNDAVRSQIIDWLNTLPVDDVPEAADAVMRQLAELFGLHAEHPALIGKKRWQEFFFRAQNEELLKALDQCTSAAELEKLKSSSLVEAWQKMRERLTGSSLYKSSGEACTKKIEQKLEVMLRKTPEISGALSWVSQGAGDAYLSLLQTAARTVLSAKADTYMPESVQSCPKEKLADLFASWNLLGNLPALKDIPQAHKMCSAYRQIESLGWKKQLLPLLARGIPDCGALSDYVHDFGAACLKSKDSFTGKLPELFKSVNRESGQVDWGEYLKQAYKQDKPWNDINLFKADTVAYPVISLILSELADCPELSASFRQFLDRSAFGQRAKKQAKGRLKYAKNQIPSHPMLDWLMSDN